MKFKLFDFILIIIIFSIATNAQFSINMNLTNSTCYNTVLDGDETGIDCGGSCNACPTCSDSIQNQGEENIDCGGPCSACPTCSDNIKNQGEEKVDCGGPCSSCETGGGGSSGGSGASPVISKNKTIELSKKTTDQIDELVVFKLKENEILNFTIDLINLINDTNKINISIENLPDFMHISITDVNVSPYNKTKIIITTNPDQYRKGNYTITFTLSTENYVKNINLNIEIAEIKKSLESIDKQNMLKEPKNLFQRNKENILKIAVFFILFVIMFKLIMVREVKKR